MPKDLLLFLLIAGFSSCAGKEPKTKTLNDDIAYRMEVIKMGNPAPTVDIKAYSLIEAQDESRKRDAAQILELKQKWPLVMQMPNRAGFDTILSKHFTFAGDGNLLNREDYIIDRTKPSDWKITFVKYDNLVLQFFGNTALLTYRNQVTNENIHTKEVEIEHISWADIYVMEEGKWKIGATHTVDLRLEKNDLSNR